MIAYNLTRKEIHYRHDAFSAGLRAVGYEVSGGHPVGRPGVHALVAGIPVICEAPYWICKEAAFRTLDSSFSDTNMTDAPRMKEFREQGMHCLAWGQWHISEIESGEAFRVVLQNVEVRRLPPTEGNGE